MAEENQVDNMMEVAHFQEEVENMVVAVHCYPT